MPKDNPPANPAPEPSELRAEIKRVRVRAADGVEGQVTTLLVVLAWLELIVERLEKIEVPSERSESSEPDLYTSVKELGVRLTALEQHTIRVPHKERTK